MKRLKQMLTVLALLVGVIFIAPITPVKNNAQQPSDTIKMGILNRDSIRNQIMSEEEIAYLKRKHDSMDKVGNKIVKEGGVILANSKINRQYSKENARLADSAMALARRYNKRIAAAKKVQQDTPTIYLKKPPIDDPKTKEDRKWWDIFNKKNK